MIIIINGIMIFSRLGSDSVATARVDTTATTAAAADTATGSAAGDAAPTRTPEATGNVGIERSLTYHAGSSRSSRVTGQGRSRSLNPVDCRGEAREILKTKSCLVVCYAFIRRSFVANKNC